MYGAISYTFAYYGEMITYLGMTMPMAVFALISWNAQPLQRQQGRGEGERDQPERNRLDVRGRSGGDGGGSISS